MRKRVISLMLMLLIVTNLWVQESYAASPAVTLDPLSYFLSLLLNSAGVQVSLSSVASWVGVEDSYEDYVRRGKLGQLSAYSQWVYDQTADNDDEGELMKAEFDRCFGGLIGLNNAEWGEKITLSDGAMQGFCSGLKSWLSTFPAYGTDTMDYTVKGKAFSTNWASAYGDITLYPNLEFDTRPGYAGRHYLVSSSDDVYVFFAKGENKWPDTGVFCAFSMSPFTYVYPYGGKDNYLESVSGYTTYEGVEIDYYTYHMSWSAYGASTYQLPYDYIDQRNTSYSGSMESFVGALFSRLAKSLYKNDVTSVAKIPLPVEQVNAAVQKSTLGTIGDTITLPADEISAQEKLEGINLQDDIENILKSLIAGGIAIDMAPDIPDESETTTEDADKKTIIAKLSDILAKLEAIPKAIAEFFTLDTVAIDTAFKNLLAAFSSKFDVLAKLVNIFKDMNRTFSDTPPVFKMQTPDCLKFAIKDDTMTVLDLTGYKDVFFWVRGILAASIWFAFGKWLLDQFDVKFHIG